MQKTVWATATRRKRSLKGLIPLILPPGYNSLGSDCSHPPWLQLAQSCAGRSCSRLSLGALELQLLKTAVPHVCCTFCWVFPCPVYFCDTRNQGNNNFRKKFCLTAQNGGRKTGRRQKPFHLKIATQPKFWSDLGQTYLLYFLSSEKNRKSQR